MALNPLYNEKFLLQQLAEDGEKAFGSLYNGHHDVLYNFVLKYVKSPDLAEDLTQEVFIKIWELRKGLTEVDSFKAYLFTVGKNHTLNFLKKASRENAAKGEILRHFRPVMETGEDKLISEEYRKFIQGVLDSLPAQTREIFRLCREQNMSYDEVASILGITRHAVKKHMVRSHKTFKDLLSNKPDRPLGLLLILFLKF